LNKKNNNFKQENMQQHWIEKTITSSKRMCNKNEQKWNEE
jgi:hypothetical protein